MAEHALIQYQDIGDSFSGVYYVENVFIKQTVQGKDYLDLTLRDRSGARFAKYWGLADVNKGDWVFVAVNVEDYHGSASLIVKNIEKAEHPDDLSDYMPTYDDADKHADRFDQIREVIKALEEKTGDKTAGMLVDEVYGNAKVFEKFTNAPGSTKTHYGRRGGLLANTVRVADACLKLSELYPLTDEEKSILLASSLLFRTGCIEAFEFRDCVPVETTSGVLLGVNNLTMNRVSSALKRVVAALKKSGGTMNQDTVIRILHAVASYDSKSVVPATKEALILENSFVSDAEVVEAIEFIEGDVNENEDFTAYDPSSRRRYYTG